MTERDETSYKRRGGEAVYHNSGFDIGSGRFDLGVPGLVAECVEALYRSTGVPAVQRDRLPYAAVVVGVILGLGFGFHPDGMLYGPIGAALGVIFGAVGGVFAGLFLHFAARPILRPEAEALRQVRMGNFQNAGRTLRRAERWIWRDRNSFERIARLILPPLGIGRSDLPPEIAAANLVASEGILAESVGDVEEAMNSYLGALDLWPRHTFVLASLIELTMREKTWDRMEEVVNTADRFLERARDPRLVSTVKEHLQFLEAEEHKEKKPPEWKPKEEETPYVAQRLPASGLQCRIVENPGSQISNGVLIVKHGVGDEKLLKLPAMPFHMVLILAEYMKSQDIEGKDSAQMGWVTIQELLDKLPWTTPHVTNSNVHKLVYKVRTQLTRVGMDRNLIEENLNGCYRLRVSPKRVTIERAVRV